MALSQGVLYRIQSQSQQLPSLADVGLPKEDPHKGPLRWLAHLHRHQPIRALQPEPAPKKGKGKGSSPPHRAHLHPTQAPKHISTPPKQQELPEEGNIWSTPRVNK
eukprot:3306714-Amphidinium_carterae.3